MAAAGAHHRPISAGERWRQNRAVACSGEQVQIWSWAKKPKKEQRCFCGSPFLTSKALIAGRDSLQFVDVSQRLPCVRVLRPFKGVLHHVLPRWLVESLPHIAQCVYLAMCTSDARVRRLLMHARLRSVLTIASPKTHNHNAVRKHPTCRSATFVFRSRSPLPIGRGKGRRRGLAEDAHVVARDRWEAQARARAMMRAR
jgi:hypothetical protein